MITNNNLSNIDAKSNLFDESQRACIDRITKHAETNCNNGNNNGTNDKYKKMRPFVAMKTTYAVCKKCPHCGHINENARESNYIVCGYGFDGFDWKGCGKDWCFRCEKKLCKKWDTDALYVMSNRKHNYYCCKSYCDKNNDDLNEYYKCITK
jgi:hypothetical protein